MRKQNRRHEGAIVQESTILSQAVPSIRKGFPDPHLIML